MNFLSSVKTLPRYLNFCASRIYVSPFCNLHVGPFFLLTTCLKSMTYVAVWAHNTHCPSKSTVHDALTLQVLMSEFITLIFIDLLDSWVIGVWIEQVKDPKHLIALDYSFSLITHTTSLLYSFSYCFILNTINLEWFKKHVICKL